MNLLDEILTAHEEVAREEKRSYNDYMRKLGEDSDLAGICYKCNEEWFVLEICNTCEQCPDCCECKK